MTIQNTRAIIESNNYGGIFMKKIMQFISAVLILAMLAGVGTVYARSYPDFEAKPSSESLENYMFCGFPDGSFKPDKPMTRAELLIII